MNCKTLNRIKRVQYWILNFIFFPFIILIGYFATDWEEKTDRDYFIKKIKELISFGFWK